MKENENFPVSANERKKKSKKNFPFETADENFT